MLKSTIKYFIFLIPNISLANIINTDIINESCSNSYNSYYNCNFSRFTNKSLTTTKSFSLPMVFTVEYSRGSCRSSYSRGHYQEGNFKLMLSSNLENKSIYPGNYRVKLNGNSLMLIDGDQWISSNASYNQPCRLVIKNIEIDFSDKAKESIASIVSRKNIAGLPSKQREILVNNIIEIQNLIATQNIKNLPDNLKNLIDNLDTLNENLLDQRQRNMIQIIINSISNNSNKLEAYISNSLTKTLDNIKEKLSKKIVPIEFKEQYDNSIQLHSILHEIENEPFFKKSSVQYLKDVINN